MELDPRMFALATEGLRRAFGRLTAVEDVRLRVRPGEIRALIGPNGAGKTTLLNLLAGVLQPDAGKIFLKGEDITRMPVHQRARRGLTRSYQVVNLFPGLTCREVVQIAVQRDLALASWIAKSGAAGIARRADEVLAASGLREVANEESTRISHGLQKRLEIALALVSSSQLLLLDEPMAGMSARERIDLREQLRRLAESTTILFIEHDIDMVMSFAHTVTVMHNGRIIAEGSPSDVQTNAAAQAAYLGAQA